jgi:hypothetical protein
MTDFVETLDVRYESEKEAERRLKEAHRLDELHVLEDETGIRTLLQSAVTPKPATELRSKS